MTRKEEHSPLAPDEPVLEIDSIELLWEQHKTKIIAGAAAIVIAIVGVFGWLTYSAAQRSGSEKAFADAKTTAEYQAVIEKYPSSPVAGDAALLVGKALRDEKKYDDANKVLNQFVEKQPEHPFAPLAKVAVAENLALAGKIDEATKALEQIYQVDGKSFVAPFALLTEAELKAAQGQREAAVKAYRQLSKTYPESVSARASAPMAEAYEAMAVTPTAAASPTPTPAP